MNGMKNLCEVQGLSAKMTALELLIELIKKGKKVKKKIQKFKG